MKNEERNPSRSADTPPISGPRLEPMKVEELISPSARVRCTRGVPAAISVAEAVTVPVNSPCSARRTNTVCTDWAKPRATASSMAEARARTIISLRPKRSDTKPQNGAARAMATPGAAAVIPTHSLSEPGSLTPSSRMNSGMNGRMKPKPVSARICASQAR